MEMSKRTVDWLAIDLAHHETRKRQAARAMTLEERTKRALAKGEALLAQARLSHRLSNRV
jgi:hypothetical protein